MFWVGRLRMLVIISLKPSIMRSLSPALTRTVVYIVMHDAHERLPAVD